MNGCLPREESRTVLYIFEFRLFATNVKVIFHPVDGKRYGMVCQVWEVKYQYSFCNISRTAFWEVYDEFKVYVSTEFTYIFKFCPEEHFQILSKEMSEKMIWSTHEIGRKKRKDIEKKFPWIYIVLRIPKQNFSKLPCNSMRSCSSPSIHITFHPKLK